MTRDHSTDYLEGLINESRKLPHETEWVEFKTNKAEPENIGEYLSALANSAALAGKAFAYLIWGIDNETHNVVGTHFDPQVTKVGNEELENWLLRQLTPRIDFRFFETVLEGRKVVLLEIARAFRHPVQFKGQEYIRVGSYKKKLKEFPEKERALWRIFDPTPFEESIAVEKVSAQRVLDLLDYSAYFELAKRPMPTAPNGILKALETDDLIRASEAGGWNIFNLGAILFAKNLSDFRLLGRKAVRVIFYDANSRIRTKREQEGIKGYAAGFEGLISYINDRLPSNEVMGQALRGTVPMYPELSVRELVANALIHQDFFVRGSGPMIEVFSDRMEISNPGEPIVNIERFLDTPPKSRNESLASLMRRFGICEERGSGIDKVVFETELYQLPAPRFEVTGETTRSVLFSHQPLTKMDREDRVRACYMHACLKYVNREYLTNSTIRQRFNIEPQNSAAASRIIKDAVDAEAIVPHDVTAAPKYMKYMPWWATEAYDGT